MRGFADYADFRSQRQSAPIGHAQRAEEDNERRELLTRRLGALRQLRADPATRAIPAIAVTASAMTQDRQTIMAAGFEGYQSKPLDVKAFLEAVRRTLAESAKTGR